MNKPESWRSALVAELLPDAHEIHQRLNQIATLPEPPASAPLDRRALIEHFLEDWRSSRIAQQQAIVPPPRSLVSRVTGKRLPSSTRQPLP